MKRVVLFLLVLAGLFEASAQCPFASSNVLNGSYVKETNYTRKVVSYPPLVERDVMWSNRVWRVIDLREKINLPMYYPLEPANGIASLWDIIKCSVLDGSLTAYSPGPLMQDDEFTYAYTQGELAGIMRQTDTVWTEGLDNPDELIPVIVTTELETQNIRRYMLKEDWFFDKQRSVMDVRIVGIAPIREVKGEDGEFRGYAPVFWLYFPECRYVFANATVFNRGTNSREMTYDDLFWKRMFSSFIVKESNVYDRKINEYAVGEGVIFESEKIKGEIARMEHDMWHF